MAVACLLAVGFAASAEPPIYDQRGRLTELKAQATAGNVQAAATLSWILEHAGPAAEARTWLQRAAEAGDAGALLRLARQLAREGQAEAAVGWLRRGAEAGQGYAQMELGDHLRSGDGVPVDAAAALGWYSAAARQGIPEAFLRRAEVLAGSEATPLDPVGAYANALVAEILADDSDLEQLQRAAAVRAGLDARLTPAERAEAWSRAQGLSPGLRLAWWRGLILPGLFLLAVGWLAASAGFALFLVWRLIRWLGMRAAAR